ncbi:MAG: hypothetical protein NTW19_13050 [Planctomycetota bacterium]|nr:hypothetical protein [Planctomycetota bacterium]
MAIARVGAFFLMLGAMLLFFASDSTLFSPLLGTAALGICLAPAAVLLRDPRMGLALVLPLLFTGHHHVRLNVGWCLVALSFAMLAAGACASLLKGALPPPTGGTPPPSPTGPETSDAGPAEEPAQGGSGPNGPPLTGTLGN